MTGRPAFLALTILVLLLCGIAPDAMGKNPLQAIELGALYQKSLTEKPTGVYPLTDYLVFVADIERTDKSLTSRDMRKKGMLKVGDLLKSWSLTQCGKVECDLSGWPERTRTLLKRELQKAMNSPSPSQFHGHVLENKQVNLRYRYAIALPKGELKQFCSRQKMITADSSILFNTILTSALQQHDYALAAVLFWDAGLPHLAARASLEDMEDRYCMTNYAMVPSPLSQRASLKMLLDGALAPKPENLSKIPGSPEILQAMAGEHLKTHPEKGFALLGLALPGDAAGSAKLLDQMKGMATGKRMAPPKWEGPDSETFRISLSTYGNFRFGEGVQALDNGYMRQAMQLFSKRGKTADIKKLLAQAAVESPANPKIWDYLGAILKAEKRWHQASAAYLQLLQIRTFDSEALGHLAECYAHMGRENAAKTIADFLVYSGRTHGNTILQRITNKIRREDS